MEFQPLVMQYYESLSKSNKLVADYFLANWEAVAFATLEEAAKQIGVSTTTVIRFSRAIGFQGYSTLQQLFQNNIRNKVGLPQRLDLSMERAQRAQLLVDSFNNDITNLSKTLETIRPEKLAEAVRMIVGARNVYLLGSRACFSVAHYMAVRLGQVRENVRLIQGIGGIYPEETVSIGPEDVCIAYMLPRYSRIMMNALACAKNQQSRIIVITGPSHKNFDDFADVVLPCWVRGVTIKNSLVVPICLSQYLVAEVMMSDYARSKDVLSKIENALQKGNYFAL